MKKILAWALAVAMALMAVPLTASAQHWHGGYAGHYWRGGGWHHGWYGGRFGWWWVVDGGWYYYSQPVYPYPAEAYVEPPVVVQQAPVVVQAQPAPVQAAPAAPAPQFWYYCDAAKGYYPYVASCPGGWRTVPAAPSGAPQ